MNTKWLLPALLLTGVTALFGADTAATTAEAEGKIYTEEMYWRDWYSPGPDWRSVTKIGNYNVNTRIPEIVWVPYEGAYASGLRIRPIDQTRLEKQIEAHLVEKTPASLKFDPARENDQNRTVYIDQLNVDASDMIGVSFKMKGPGNLKLNTGLGIIDTADPQFEDKTVNAAEGFKAYRMSIPAQEGRTLRELAITVDAANSLEKAGEYVVIDLVYHYSKKHPYVKDIAPRVWAVDEGETDIGGVYTYMNSEPKGHNVEVMNLPIDGWLPRIENEKVENCKIEYITEKLNGKDIPAVRFTLTKGKDMYWINPIKFDPTKFNTMSFLYKVEVPEGSLVTGAQRPPDWGWAANEYHVYFDNFGVNYLSKTRDVIDWSAMGVTRAGSAFMKQKENVSPEWNVFAWDNLHDEMTGNKDFAREATSHWSLWYGAAKIPEGKQVVITIANPKVASGIMRTGGDMKKYKEFKKEFANLKYDYSDSSKYLGAPETGRLPKPLQIMKNGIFEGEIVVAGWSERPALRQKAAEELRDLINLYCSPLSQNIPILSEPSNWNNVKIFLGTGSFGQRFLTEEQRASLEKDSKDLAGTAGCAIRTFGKNIFIFGGNFQYRPNNGNYPGPDRGTLNGVYLFMENNTDMIHASFGNFKDLQPGCDTVFTRPKGGNWSIVWGDYFHRPSIETYCVSGSPTQYVNRNLGNFRDWHYNGPEKELGFRRHRLVNHWFGFGARTKREDGSFDWETPNEKWGIGTDGKRMKPDCYTGHPCLINVLEDAKDEYVTCVFEKADPNGEERQWQVTDKIALWLEDTQKICVCPKCTAPIRLPNGELVKDGETDFRSTQFFAQTNAMIQAYNVYVQPDQYVEPIVYFWEFSIPRGPLSRMIRPKVCPYVRKNYKEPIYAPINDCFWRNYVRWSQLTGSKLSQYEYFLVVNFRPWADINRYDLDAEIDLGVIDYMYEGGDVSVASFMERWVISRQGWDPKADPMQLRKQFIRRTYQEAAPDMEKFYFTLQKSYYNDPIRVEFEDGDARMAQIAMWTQSEVDSSKTLAEELTGYLDAAVKNVKNPLSQTQVAAVRTAWLTYLENAKAAKQKAGMQ